MSKPDPEPDSANRAKSAVPFSSEAGRGRILIGSQRDPAIPIRAAAKPKPKSVTVDADEDAADDRVANDDTSMEQPAPIEAVVDAPRPQSAQVDLPIPAPTVEEPARTPVVASSLDAGLDPVMSLDDEIEAALGGLSIENLMAVEVDATVAELEPDARIKATIRVIHGDNVFFSLQGRYEGLASLRQFKTPPQIGATMDVIVKRFNAADGLYDVAVPGSSISVADWSDLAPGTIVEARVTGSNTGGLEVLVNSIRGFIPASQVDLFRVEQFGDYVNQRFQCVVTEANEGRQKLVLSRRAILEREKEAKRKELLESIAVGDLRDGVVTKLMDFGAFVDIGGLEGLAHISKLSWDRVKHPSEVLTVGEKIKVKVERVDTASGKISLSYRDTLQDPWQNIEQKYPVNSVARGVVSRIAQFGAFVKLEPGIEGLVHISELAHHRVFAVRNVVQEGAEVDVKILSVDRDAQKIGLSIKATQARPEPKSSAKDEPEPDEPPRPLAVRPSDKPLKGGRERRSGGDSVGLHW